MVPYGSSPKKSLGLTVIKGIILKGNPFFFWRFKLDGRLYIMILRDLPEKIVHCLGW